MAVAPTTAPPIAAPVPTATPAFPNTATVTSLTEYTQLFESKMTALPGSLWYRGCGDSDHRLEPTLFRHPTRKTITDLLNLEANLLTHFRQRSLPYISNQTINDWDLLFLMQHFGVPTRLLDWTENPYIALYFALSSAKGDSSTGTEIFKKDASIWVLDPVEWNRHSLKHMSYKDGILSVADARIKTYTPSSNHHDTGEMLNQSVTIYGTHNSPRIIAQRGAFMVFGKDTQPADLAYQSLHYPPESLTKIVIPKDKITQLTTSLFKIGYTDAVVFPDLEGLAREIKRLNGFSR